EDDYRARGDRGGNQGEGDGAQDPPTRRPHDACRLLDERVGRRQRTLDYEEDEREVRQRQSEDDAERPEDRRHSQAREVLDGAGEDAVASKKQDPRVGPDERWRYQRDHRERQDQIL